MLGSAVSGPGLTGVSLAQLEHLLRLVASHQLATPITVGSANFTRNAHARNIELGVVIEDVGLANAVVRQWRGLVESTWSPAFPQPRHTRIPADPGIAVIRPRRGAEAYVGMQFECRRDQSVNPHGASEQGTRQGQLNSAGCE